MLFLVILSILFFLIIQEILYRRKKSKEELYDYLEFENFIKKIISNRLEKYKINVENCSLEEKMCILNKINTEDFYI